MISIGSNADVTCIFRKSDDVPDYRCWLELIELRLNKGNCKSIIIMLEATAVTLALFGPKRYGYPEAIFSKRNFTRALIERDFPLSMRLRSLLNLKYRNLEQLALNTFSDLKKGDPDVYLRLVQSGLQNRLE
jgi:hypothetical protein